MANHRLPLPTRLLLLLLPLLLLLAADGVRADGDWQNHCGACKCTWNSGKKQADCKSHSFTAVPTQLTTELQVIDLSYNPIAELRAREFGEALLENMHKIYMRNCTMQEISRDAFKGLEVLIELDLSHNQLRQLHVGTFANLLRLRTILLNHNQLERLDDHLFADLQFLYKLEVRANRLHHIGQLTFLKSQNVINIELAQNRLTQLQPETFHDMANLKSLALGDNPWNCTCTLQQFQQFVMANKLYTPPTACAQPAALRGRLWSELSAENFACRPRIVQPLGDVAVEATDENVTLTCRINGSPRPTIDWVHNRRVIGFGDKKISIRNSQEVNRADATDVYTSELTISGMRAADRGEYICSAANLGGKAEVVFRVSLSPQRGGFLTGAMGGGGGDGGGGDGVVQRSGTNLLFVVCVVVIVLLAVLIVVVVVLCCYCRRVKKYAKNGSISESGLMGGAAGKMDKSAGGGGMMMMGGMGGSGGGGMGGGGQLGQGDSMLEGSVIMEMQKSLLTDVNPVEKPPRRVELDGGGSNDGGGMMDEGMELKKTLLDDTMFGNQDDETQSVSLSDTTARSRTTYIDDGYGTNLPPDLLAFPSRFAQSPSLQSSVSHLPSSDAHTAAIYGMSGAGAKSPPHAASPIYQHSSSQAHHLAGGHPLLGAGIYAAPTSTPIQSGYRTLQLPKQRHHHHQHGMSLLAQHQHNQQQHQQLMQHQQSPAPHQFGHHPQHQQHQLVQAHGTLRSHSPYAAGTTTPAAATAGGGAYPAVVMKQGYVTIPRKPRTPSWTPSLTSTMTADYPLLQSPTPSSAATAAPSGAAAASSSGLTSPVDMAALIAAEPVYDNLGLRTTASGNSAQQQLNKLAAAQAAAAQQAANNGGSKFPMKDRPLPATPRSMAGGYEPIPEQQQQQQLPQQQQQHDSLLSTYTDYTDMESLYGTTSRSTTDGGAAKTVKVPPRPPPKPKKKTTTAASVANASTSEQTGSTSHLFEDECEDGTEV